MKACPTNSLPETGAAAGRETDSDATDPEIMRSLQGQGSAVEAPDLAVSAWNLEKRFRLWQSPAARLKFSVLSQASRILRANVLLPQSVLAMSGLLPRLKRAREKLYEEFHALHNVSFTLRQGESTGIIGRNGSGKSTLLQILAGTLRPTAGGTEVYGRVAALLELGSGFNAEFTGRENVYLNAAVLGCSRAQIKARFAAIAAFAEIGSFMDQPVKTYSSGMMLRLAFAINAHIDADVLIIDEALAVGDAPFQARCFARLRELLDRGVTMILVSHDLATIRSLCQTAIHLRAGRLVDCGPAKRVCDGYEMECIAAMGVNIQPNTDSRVGVGAWRGTNLARVPTVNPRYEKSAEISRKGNGDIRIIDFYLADSAGQMRESFAHDEDVFAMFLLQAHGDINHDVNLSFTVKDLKGRDYFTARDSFYHPPLCLKAGGLARATLKLRLPLRAGDYYATIGILSFTRGEKYKNGLFNFNESTLCDWVEYGCFFQVAPFLRHWINGPVHLESELSITEELAVVP